MARFCGNCGTEMEENSLFCGECGWKDEETGYIPEEIARDQEEKMTVQDKGHDVNGKRTGILIGTIFLVVIVLILGVTQRNKILNSLKIRDTQDGLDKVEVTEQVTEPVTEQATEPLTEQTTEKSTEEIAAELYSLDQLNGTYSGSVKVSFSDNIADMGMTEEDLSILQNTPFIRIILEGDQLIFGFYDEEYEGYSDMPAMTIDLIENQLTGSSQVTDLATATFNAEATMVIVDDVEQMMMTGFCTIEFLTEDGKGATLNFDFVAAR